MVFITRFFPMRMLRWKHSSIHDVGVGHTTMLYPHTNGGEAREIAGGGATSRAHRHPRDPKCHYVRKVLGEGSCSYLRFFHA